MLFHPMGTISSETDEKVQHSELGASGGSNRRPDFLCKIHLKSSLQDQRPCFPGCSRLVPKTPRLPIDYLLLRFCGSFCKLVHLARSTPPSLVAEALSFFDSDIRHCFTECTSVDVSDIAWHQAQLSPGRGGLGLRSLYHHSSACFIASICQSGIALGENHHLEQSIDDLNHIIGVSEALNLHLEPPEFQVALKWWLGMDTSQNACCAFCPSHALDPLGHHALTCKSGGDLIVRHNALRDTFLESCKQACIGGQLEAGPIAASPVPGSGQSSHDPAGGQELLFIPIVFILLRIWGTLEFIFTEVYSKYFCTNSPAFLGVLSALRFLQAIGDGGQGWSNAILYIFNSPKFEIFC
eukprot:Em0476g1a